MSDLVGNPEDRFSRVEAHMIKFDIQFNELIFLKVSFQSVLDLKVMHNIWHDIHHV